MNAPILKEGKSKLEENISLDLQAYLTVKSFGERIWIVDEATRKTLFDDALKFHGELRKIFGSRIGEFDREELAVRLAFEKRKLAVHPLEVKTRLLLEAREKLGIERITDPKEYIPSQVSFLVTCGVLDKKSGDKVSQIAYEILDLYDKNRHDKKLLPIEPPITLSAAAIYYASNKAEPNDYLPIATKDLGIVSRIDPDTIIQKTRELVKIARPEEINTWKRGKIKFGYLDPR